MMWNDRAPHPVPKAQFYSWDTKRMNRNICASSAPQHRQAVHNFLYFQKKKNLHGAVYLFNAVKFLLQRKDTVIMWIYI